MTRVLNLICWHYCILSRAKTGPLQAAGSFQITWDWLQREGGKLGGNKKQRWYKRLSELSSQMKNPMGTSSHLHSSGFRALLLLLPLHLYSMYWRISRSIIASITRVLIPILGHDGMLSEARTGPRVAWSFLKSSTTANAECYMRQNINLRAECA